MPVLDEHAIRTAAGILLATGITAFTITLVSGSVRPLQTFGMFFLLDMTTRILISDRLSLTLALGRALKRRRRPLWVGAPQKVFAWWLALGIAAVSCVTMSAGIVPLAVTLGLCGICFTLLLLEAVFGWCAGCALHQRFSRQPTRHCATGACDR
ncbi:DUF4395 family protein [Microbacterium invictum]|uniref:DUF4395 domain-containing protein n=1 Tax=Microbacterium invictum TaxID=515415 RepID=A0AA40SQF5_9MICO|nr:DUF4395 domain-containing protein [Microbacterium invictum]MBB4140355.1 hypothetical protein [Microbacterium invictum]